MYKLILLDVDGTLVASKGDALPSARVIATVQAASKVADVAIVTGRPYSFTQDVIAALGLTGYAVFNGGAEIIDTTTGEQIFRQTMSIETTQEVAMIALTYGYPVFNTLGSVDDMKVTSPEDITEPSDKLLIEHVPTQEAFDIVAALEAVEGTIAHPVSA